MKSPDRKTVSKLDKLPNIGPKISADLELIGINHPKQLIGKNPFKLHEKLCQLTNTKHDPCVIDVFMAVIDFMEGGEVKVWWEFTAKRKEILLNSPNISPLNKTIDTNT